MAFACAHAGVISGFAIFAFTMLCVVSLTQLWLNCLVAFTHPRSLIPWRGGRTVVNVFLLFTREQNLAASEISLCLSPFSSKGRCTFKGPGM
ncbi:hypothetical protein BJY52DRAFT_1314923, partial [Lactarius psammicola]